MKQILFLIISLLASIAANPLDDYVSAEDPNYKWREVPELSFKSFFGGTGHVLNVTSQKWLDESKVAGPDGALWTHQVIVIVPKNLRFRNISLAYLTGSCNTHPDAPVDAHKDEDVLVVDEIAHDTGAVAIAVKQIPNCPLVFPSDPSQKKRSEDAILAWAWKEFLEDPAGDPKWLPRLPMAKAGYQTMRAAQEFLHEQKLAEVEGWVVAGASKRGWTTWMVGATKCETCAAKILAINPLVPIVPELVKEVHRQWRAYNGFTFAFADYTAVNLTQHMDDAKMAKAMEVIDPINYMERLDKIPKIVVLSSDDEFMMMDWTNIYWDKLGGEKHLLIAPNAEHSLATGLKTVLQTMGAFVRSLATQNQVYDRPIFDHTFNNKTGEIIVQVPPQNAKLKRVSLSYAETLQSTRRDFRWIIQGASNQSKPCPWPLIPVPSGILEEKKQLYSLDDDTQLCIQPIIWKSLELKEVKPGQGVYVAQAPKPKHDGRWVGYFVDVFFYGDVKQDHFSLLKNEYHFTTTGWTNPNTLPFDDCYGEECIGRLV